MNCPPVKSPVDSEFAVASGGTDGCFSPAVIISPGVGKIRADDGIAPDAMQKNGNAKKLSVLVS